jgi:hypothetical protein
MVGNKLGDERYLGQGRSHEISISDLDVGSGDASLAGMGRLHRRSSTGEMGARGQEIPCASSRFRAASACLDWSSTQVAIFMGFVSGVYDASGERGCTPESLTGREVFDVVIAYLEQHPEQHHLSGSRLVADSLQQAFPCEG